MFGEQLPQLEESDEPSLLTLTIGGNDLLSAFSTKPRLSLLEAIARDVAEAYEFLVDALQRARPNAHRGARDDLRSVGRHGAHSRRARRGRPAAAARAGPVSTIASGRSRRGTPRTALADVHAHFLGHGVLAPEEDRWYWRRSLIEPNARGASEIRRLWLEVLDSL